MSKLPILVFVFISVSSMAQTNGQVVKFENPSSVFTPKGYSQMVEVDLGNSKMILISGQVAFDKEGNLVGKGDLAKQVEQTFMNIKNIIEHAGGTMNDIVRLNNYVLDISQVQVLRNIRDKYVNIKNPPASTAVQVSKLFRDDVLVEIEATAIIPKKR